jgi:hypothetical protein
MASDNQPKECPNCGNTFVKPYSRSIWAKTIFCSTSCSIAFKRQEPADRFWKHISPPNESGCRLWNGALSDGRYGNFWDGGGHKKAHIYAWELQNGPVPHGMKVCHQCDTPRCVEETHLFLGTQLDNLRDMVAKGRGARGERHYLAKLTDEKVVAIRAFSGTGKACAEQFGVSQATISVVRSGKKWAHVTQPSSA